MAHSYTDNFTVHPTILITIGIYYGLRFDDNGYSVQ
jgi:hypothetical protein